MTHFKGYLTHFDTWFGTTFLARFFQMEERGTTFFREFGGAVATFMTMAYILAVNPRILSDSGGPCVPDAPEDVSYIIIDIMVPLSSSSYVPDFGVPLYHPRDRTLSQLVL